MTTITDSANIKKRSAAFLTDFATGLSLVVLFAYLSAYIDDLYILAAYLLSIPFVPGILRSLMTYKYRGSIGKILLHIQVVDERTSLSPSLFQCFLRETIGKYISLLILGIGFIWAFFNEKRMGWHDYLARTQVYDKS